MVGGAITAPPAATPEPNMRPFGCTQAILSHSSGSSVSITFHSRKYPTDVIAQAQSVLEGWKQFDPALPAIGALEAQLTSLRNQRDDVLNTACGTRPNASAPPSKASTATTHPNTKWSAAPASASANNQLTKPTKIFSSSFLCVPSRPSRLKKGKHPPPRPN